MTGSQPVDVRSGSRGASAPVQVFATDISEPAIDKARPEVVIDVELLEGNPGDDVEFKEVLMVADEGVRLPGARRFASERKLAGGIDIADELVARIEKLAA